MPSTNTAVPESGPNSPHWRAFTAECTLAADQIAAGARNLKQLEPASIGSFYAALFPLSIGYERMAKVALQIDAKITTGRFLTPTEMKSRDKAGHYIDALFDRVEELAVRHGYDHHPNGQRPTDDITAAVVAVLTEFAIGGRYNHLDSLGDPANTGPSAEQQWDTQVMQPITDIHLSPRKTTKIVRTATLWNTPVVNSTAHGIGVLAFHHDVDGSFHTNPETLALRTGLYAELIPYARIYALRPGRWLASILDHLSMDSMAPGPAHGLVPTLNDFFGWLDNDDYYFRQRSDPAK